MQLEQILLILFGLLAGGAIALWIASLRFGARYAAERALLDERIAERDRRLADLQSERSTSLAEIQRLRDETARLQAREEVIEQLRASLAERLAEIESLRQETANLRASGTALQSSLAEKDALLKELRESQERLSTQFRALAAEALQANNQTFVELARQEITRLHTDSKGSLETLVKPLHEQLDRMDRNVVQLERSRAESDGRLKEQIAALHTVEQQLRAETSNLVSALRAPAVRGRWGEVQLRRVVELAGMLDHVDFSEQFSIQTDNGVQRPDMIIHLPSNRKIVVDAKVSLQGYLEALDAPDELTRTACLSAHAAQIKSHLNRLADKRYWNQFPEAPEFVVAFLPAETFFSAALERDPSLIEFGAGQGVILATPTTLIALLKAVAYGWQQEKLADNARVICQLGQTLYDRLRTFTAHIDDIRRHLSRTVDSYNKAAASLETRVLVSARRFRELGAATTDPLTVLEPVETAPRHLQVLEQGSLGFDDDADAEKAIAATSATLDFD